MATKKKTEDIIAEEIIEETVDEVEAAEAEAEATETETAETEVKERRSFSPLADEGVRGDGTAKWYVVHTYSGYENKVKNSIDRMVEYRGMQDRILEVVIPTEDRIEIKDGVKKVKTRKLFPGYVVIKMIVDNETWYLVRNTEGVTGFVGHGSDPIPLTKEEIVRMGIEKMKIDLDIEVGDTIRIIGGVFEGQLGIVEAVNPEKQAAHEIARLLNFPGFLSVDSFAKGNVEIVELKVDAKNPLNGTKMSKLQDTVHSQVLVCAVLRNGQAIMPDGNFVIRENDQLFITATPTNLTQMLRNLGIES